MARVKSLSTAILSSSKWHLAPAGRTTCDYGSPAPQNDCLAAVEFAAAVANKTPGRNIQVGNGGTCNDASWGGVPLGCSVMTGGDWTAHYKTSGVNCNTRYQLVCSDSGNLCDRLLQQLHRFDEELSVQGKWQGGSVTGVCKGWGTDKVGLGFTFFEHIDAIFERNASQHCICYLVSITPLYV